MTLVKTIDAATWAALPEIDVVETDDLFPQLGADTYRLIRSDVASAAVAALTAGSIDQASPSIGDTLTVSGSNATDSATYQWQESADGSTGWANISGAASASLDTSSDVTAGYYVRRQVSDGAQGPVSTDGVQVAAAASASYTYLGSDIIVDPAGSGANTATYPETLLAPDAHEQHVVLQGFYSEGSGAPPYGTSAMPSSTSGTAVANANVSNAYNGANRGAQIHRLVPETGDTQVRIGFGTGSVHTRAAFVVGLDGYDLTQANWVGESADWNDLVSVPAADMLCLAVATEIDSTPEASTGPMPWPAGFTVLGHEYTSANAAGDNAECGFEAAAKITTASDVTDGLQLGGVDITCLVFIPLAS